LADDNTSQDAESPANSDLPTDPASMGAGRIEPLDITSEMTSSYLTYAMSVIISRALPDVRDGLKPAQRRILVAMNDLNLGPSSGRIKCAKISGDTSGNYHPHGEAVIYPTLVRLAQDWVMREPLVDKQGNFGSIAGLGPAAMRYTEARMSSAAAELMSDIDRDTVDFAPTYDQRNEEPVVLPSRFPNLLVNGSQGIAVGMATSIPPHNLVEVASAVQLLIDSPDATVDDIMEVLPGPDFPTGGQICGRLGILKGYKEGRATLTVRAKV
jgi:DNA gyrase subunit A